MRKLVMGGKHNRVSNKKQEEYAVERIVADRVIKGKVQFKVHWSGYGSDDDTWENESQLDCAELLEEYMDGKEGTDLPAEEEEGAGGARDSRKGGSKSGKKEEEDSDHSADQSDSEGGSDSPAEKEGARRRGGRNTPGKGGRKGGKKEEEDSVQSDSEGGRDSPAEKEGTRRKGARNTPGKGGRKGGKKEEEDSGQSADQSDSEVSVEEAEARGRKNGGSGGKKSAKKEPVKEDKEEAEDYEVERLVDHRVLNGKTQYRVHWLGYSTDEETWEEVGTLNCPELLAAYHEARGGEPPSASPKRSAPASSKAGGKKKKRKTGEENEKKKAAPTPSTAESNPNSEYEVERILEMHTQKSGERLFLVKWVGFKRNQATWEPERNLQNTDLVEKFLLKVNKAKEVPLKELRVQRRATDRFTAMPQGDKRRQSRRYVNKQRPKYVDME